MRGEYIKRSFLGWVGGELPPRTRRILDSLVSKMEPIGTTSAHAENTYAHQWPPSPDQNYLRARGEYIAVLRSEELTMELPPRTRRIRVCRFPCAPRTGTTSAHAENTVGFGCCCEPVWNYLRARGEYHQPPTPRCSSLELPPRTRRIRFSFSWLVLYYGTTSAHAENTEHPSHALVRERNYLRARGEYWLEETGFMPPEELPPRTRRIQHRPCLGGNQSGTTSAHAENTSLPLVLPAQARNYLRARGEYPK